MRNRPPAREDARRYVSISLAVFLSVSSLCLHSSEACAAAIGQRDILPGGMVLLVSEKHAVPIVTATMLVQAGAILDPSDKSGLANLTAELLTQGTTSRSASQFSEAIEFVGGSLSVDAGLDVTTISLSVLSKDLDLGLDLLADILLHPTFAPAEIQRKAKEVVAGIKHKHEDPGELSAEAFAKLAFGEHSYGRPVEGNETSVPTISREDILRFHDLYYRPNRTILAVVGDVSPQDLRQRLEGRLKEWKVGGSAIQTPAPPAPLSGPVKRTIQRDVTQANITLGHLGVRRDNPDYYAILVMNYILGGGGFNSRLMTKIREEEGWAYDVRSSFVSDKYAGTFTVTLQTKNQTAVQAIEAVLAEMRRMRQQPVGDSELRDAKAYLTGSFPLRLDTSGKISRLLANIEYFGLGLDYVDRFPGLIDAVTVADVQRVAQQYLDPDRYALAVVADLQKAKITE
jgi:zinc protease